MTPFSGKFCTLDVKEKMTTAPYYLTESELISRMEKHGIGTDASISTHIENIQKRNYVELIAGRKLKPSRLGLVLAQGYHLIDNSLVLPQIRSDIELECVTRLPKDCPVEIKLFEKQLSSSQPSSTTLSTILVRWTFFLALLLHNSKMLVSHSQDVDIHVDICSS